MYFPFPLRSCLQKCIHKYEPYHIQSETERYSKMQFRAVQTTLGNSHTGKKLRTFMESANLTEGKLSFPSKSNYTGKIKVHEYSWSEEKGHTLIGFYLYDFVLENMKLV